MKTLFACEWRRFARWALAVGVVHLFGIFLLGRVTNPLQWRIDDQFALLLLFMLYGFVLSIIQVGAYRKQSQWLWLIHRPLPLRTVFAALFAAAVATLTVAVFLPLLVWLLVNDLFTHNVVDVRDYVSLIHLHMFGLMAWLIGALTMLSRSKIILTTLALPLVFAAQAISVWWLLVPVFICVAWLYAITAQAFRANRDAPIERNAVLVLTAFPVQVGIFLLIFHVGKIGIEAAKYLKSPPLQSEVITQEEAAALPPGAAFSMIEQGLASSAEARSAAWREQLPLVPTAMMAPILARFPVRHQFGNFMQSWWDEKRGIEWTFSHDKMRFEGRDPRSGEYRGNWGRSGVRANGAEAEAFEQVPLQLQTRERLYAVDLERQIQHEILRLPPDEWFVAEPSTALDHVLTLSNRRLRAFRPNGPDDLLSKPLVLDWEVVLPEEAARLAQVDIAQLLDGWLVSLFYFDEHNRFFSPWQQIVYVDSAGQSAVVSERHGVDDIRIITGVGGSALWPTESWWLSPVIHAISATADGAFDKGLTRPPVVELLPRSSSLWIAAGSSILVSLILAYAWLRNSNVNPTRRRVWLAICAFIGLPALLSMIFLEPRCSQA